MPFRGEGHECSSGALRFTRDRDHGEERDHEDGECNPSDNKRTAVHIARPSADPPRGTRVSEGVLDRRRHRSQKERAKGVSQSRIWERCQEGESVDHPRPLTKNALYHNELLDGDRPLHVHCGVGNAVKVVRPFRQPSE